MSCSYPVFKVLCVLCSHRTSQWTLAVWQTLDGHIWLLASYWVAEVWAIGITMWGLSTASSGPAGCSPGMEAGGLSLGGGPTWWVARAE